MHNPAPTGRRRPTPRQVFWSAFGLLFVVTGLWSLATPTMGGLDEPAHAIKAASVVRGQLVGTPFDVDPTAPAIFRSQQEGRGLVDVTALFAQLNEVPKCFAFKSDEPASCVPPVVADPDAAAQSFTAASRYNPLYYALVGLPSLLPGSSWTVLSMRLVSALLSSVLLAAAVRTVAELRRAWWPVAAVAVALTPMVLFVDSTVNPQSVELAGGMTVWVVLLALLRQPDRSLLRRRLVRLTIATLFFVNARGLGPLFLLAIVLAAVACSPLPNLVALLRERRAWPYLGLCVAAGLLAVGWILGVGSLSTTPTVFFPEYADAATVLSMTIGLTSDYIQQSLGVFGWLDTFLPGWTYLALAATVLFVAVTGFALGRWRDRAVMLALVVLAVVTPLVAHYAQARYIGPFWQGRYMLPVLFGVPVIAGFALAERGALPLWVTRRLVGWGLTAVAGLQVVAFTVALHRYVNGRDGSWFDAESDAWRPPLPSPVLVALTALAWAALAVTLFRACDGGRPVRVAPSGPARAVAAQRSERGEGNLGDTPS